MLSCIEYSVAQHWICQQQHFGTIPNFVVFLHTNVQAVAIFPTLNEYLGYTIAIFDHIVHRYRKEIIYNSTFPCHPAEDEDPF